MTHKSKSITEIITELQAQNEKLSGLGKLFDRAVKEEFGYSTKEVHVLLDRQLAYEKKRAERLAEKQNSSSEDQEFSSENS